MFGALRLLLALLVIAWHTQPSDGPLVLGTYPVAIFFVLSGYLMTAVLRGRYGYEWAGTVRFARARSLKVFPVYWAALPLMLLSAAVSTSDLGRSVPVGLGQWLSTLFLVGPVTLHDGINPPAWSLAVELMCYAAMALGATRTVRRTAVWMALSAGWIVFSIVRGESWEHLYLHPVAAGLPFSIGAMAWWARGHLRRAGAVAGFALAALFLVGSMVDRPFAMGPVFYVAMLPAAVLVGALGQLKGGAGDALMGNLAYPVYVVHWPIAALLQRWVPERGVALLALTVAATLGVSWALHRFVAAPLEAWRTRPLAPIGYFKGNFAAHPIGPVGGQ